MSWSKALFGLMVFILSITCPQQLVALLFEALGVAWLKGTLVHTIISNIVAGSAFTAGIKWLFSDVKGILRGGED